MSQVQTAMLTLVGITLAYLAIVWIVWRLRQPKAPKAPKLPRAPRAPGESRLPKLPRRDREPEAPVEIPVARLARISARPTAESLSEPEGEAAVPAFAAPAITADTLLAERPDPAPPAAPPSEADRAMVAQMLEAVVAQVEHEADLLERRGGEAVSVRLVPQIPPRRHEVATSWLGGRPRLDPGARWPEIREVPGDFVAQIACADLPRGLWDGLGPRSGSLAFFIHPRDGDAAVVHVTEAGEPLDPPYPIDANDSFFAPSGGLRFGDLIPFARHAFPEWPVDLVAVRPGDADPRGAGAEDAPGHRLYRTGYDLADPAWHPFDWDLMLAMTEILAMRIERHWREVEGPSPIDTQLAAVERHLGEAGLDPAERERLTNQRTALTELAAAAEAARATNREAQARAEEIIAIVRDSAHRLPFSAADAGAVMAALRAIRWTKVLRKADPEGRPGAERIEGLTLPLTQHHPDAALWAHDYQRIWFDHAKHVYAADPGALPEAARTVFEPWARDLAAREMAGIGHTPFRYVHDYDADSHAVLIELPTSGLMSWMFGDADHLLLTMRKADLAAGRWDRPQIQISN
ncbi:MAG TPA: DUF1963 domain-containing protein [Sphingopyxis sp.]|nr:DUF1963 domain-containing protein [Sphingopyxis sp.]